MFDASIVAALVVSRARLNLRVGSAPHARARAEGPPVRPAAPRSRKMLSIKWMGAISETKGRGRAPGRSKNLICERLALSARKLILIGVIRARLSALSTRR